MTATRKTPGKTGSRNPAIKPTSVAAWKKTAVIPPVELPSGNFMRLRKVGLQTLMKVGIMPNSLMEIATKSVSKGTGYSDVSNDDLAVLASDPKKVAELADFMNKMVVFVAQEPEVLPMPEDGVERDDDLLYIDEVDDEDKAFILQVVMGGTTDLEQFRKEHSASMDAVRGREDVELPAE